MVTTMFANSEINSQQYANGQLGQKGIYFKQPYPNANRFMETTKIYSAEYQGRNNKKRFKKLMSTVESVDVDDLQAGRGNAYTTEQGQLPALFKSITVQPRGSTAAGQRIYKNSPGVLNSVQKADAAAVTNIDRPPSKETVSAGLLNSNSQSRKQNNVVRSNRSSQKTLV